MDELQIPDFELLGDTKKHGFHQSKKQIMQIIHMRALLLLVYQIAQLVNILFFLSCIA
jgi:hypothetical protein